MAARRIRRKGRRRLAGPPLKGVSGAVLGLFAGAGAAFFLSAAAPTPETAAPPPAMSYAAALDLRDAPLIAEARFAPAAGHKAARQMAATQIELTRLSPPPAQPLRPRIALVVDDLGLDAGAFERVMALPGPLTLSFLPYGRRAGEMAHDAAAAGRTVMLHLPMAPVGAAEPGPHALSPDMDEARLKKEIAWNFARLPTFAGLNNHMGSKATRDPALMRTVAAAAAARGVFYLDSVTTADSVGAALAREMGATTYVRDVFIDAAPGRAAIMDQLDRLEAIAEQNGAAIGILHPRHETLEVIGPWLTTAPLRGFDIVAVDALPPLGTAAPASARRLAGEPVAVR